MNDDPYELFGLPPGASEEAVRSRYLELVRQHPPERDPQRFAAIRSAYDELCSLDRRLEAKLFRSENTSTMHPVMTAWNERLRRVRPTSAMLAKLADRLAATEKSR